MISTKEMAYLEDMAEKKGISKLDLMENAGSGMFYEMKKNISLKGKKILVVCGSGNNGGDGFVLARLLMDNKYDVRVLFLGKEHKLKKESSKNYFLLKNKYPNIFEKSLEKGLASIEKADIIVDAMLGTGARGRIKEPYSTVISLINKAKKMENKKTIIAVDIPTGLDPDTGEILDKAVDPDLIFTFHDLKTGLSKLKKKAVVIDIGLKGIV